MKCYQILSYAMKFHHVTLKDFDYIYLSANYFAKLSTNSFRDMNAKESAFYMELDFNMNTSWAKRNVYDY